MAKYRVTAAITQPSIYRTYLVETDSKASASDAVLTDHDDPALIEGESDSRSDDFWIEVLNVEEVAE